MCFRVWLFAYASNAIRVITRFMTTFSSSKHLDTMIETISHNKHTSVINAYTIRRIKSPRLLTFGSKFLNDIPSDLGFGIKHLDVIRRI